MLISDMTDPQVNREITMTLGGFKESDYSAVSRNFHSGKPDQEGYKVGIIKDYCGDPAHMWPLIVSAMISFEQHGHGSWVRVYGYSDNGLNEVFVNRYSILRGAAECWLMMKNGAPQ